VAVVVDGPAGDAAGAADGGSVDGAPVDGAVAGVTGTPGYLGVLTVDDLAEGITQ
jgi:hypothetical protein